MDADLGMVAYNAYGEHRDWVTFDGSPMPRWEDVRYPLRDAWRAAADAVREAVSDA